MRTDIKLSAAIICFNEEDKIAKCLASLIGVADQVVLIDSHSTDKTLEVIHTFENQLSIKLIQQPFKGYIEQKNDALLACDHDYILSLDADEALSPKLKESILKVKKNWQGEGYRFNRLTGYGNFWVRHCGWYPDTKLRLIRKNCAEWKGVNPHDILTFKDSKAKVTWIEGDLLHYSYSSITDHVNQTNRFTTIAAQASYDKGVRSSLFKIVTRPAFKFLKDYFLKAGFLDGRYGFVICYINALSAFLKYSKIYELQKGKSIN